MAASCPLLLPQISSDIFHLFPASVLENHLEEIGSSAIVSNNGFFDLDNDNLCMKSGAEKSSMSSKLSFGNVFRSTPVGEIKSADSGEIRVFRNPLLETELAVRNRAPKSAAVTVELTLFIGNMM